MDATAPTTPTNLTADGSNPSPWRNDAVFSVNCSNPSDASGIMRYYYKRGSQPTGINDTTGTSGVKPFNVTATVQGGQQVHVWLADSAGNVNFANRDSVTMRWDTTKPRLHAITADTSRMWSGMTFTMRVYAADDRKMGAVTLTYAPAGDNGAGNTTVAMYNVGDSAYLFDILGSSATTKGVQYRVAAADSAGNNTYHPSAGSFYIHKAFFSSPVSCSHPYDQWRMVSFPLDSSGQQLLAYLGDDLGSYDNTKWRMFEYKNSAYSELTDLGFGFVFGRAYWLKQRIANPLVLDFDIVGAFIPGTFTPGTTDSTAKILLTDGWNDFGDPFLFPVNWTDIKQATGSDTTAMLSAYPYTYDGTWRFPVTLLQAWQGYSVKANNTLLLRIPPKDAAKQAVAKQDELWPQGWVGTVAVSSSGGQDPCNYFGIGAGTSDAVDRYDYPEPPWFFSGAYGCFALKDNRGEYGSDIRPALGQGQTWEFAAKGSRGTTALTISLPQEFPADAICCLCDLAEARSLKITGTYSYQYQPEPGERERRFKLIAGSESYARGEVSRSLAVPAVTMLEQNKPNPFSDRTVIGYQLAQAGPVKLTVYNVLGQQMRTLMNDVKPAGRYRINWSGDGDNGKNLPNGLYFYRLVAAGMQCTRKLTLVR
ncbi:MAG: FlgD immunoglobulin-like domain containing protein [Candidatus Edwardsbacteria bacterium]|nr:FlgD immunoglobulin-like domain containing protein [Candidatus Edwardsbacteria bacterium]